MSSESPKLALFTQFAAVAKALGHPHRLELLEFVAQGERGVDSLAKRTGLTICKATQQRYAAKHPACPSQPGYNLYRTRRRRTWDRISEATTSTITTRMMPMVRS